MKLPAGTPTPDVLAYTAEQRAVLDSIHDPRYEQGIAKSQYANHTLHPDGTIDTDLDAVRKALAERARDAGKAANDSQTALIEAGAAFAKAKAADKKAALKAHTDAIAAHKKVMDEVFTAQTVMADFEYHVDQKRFLFVLREDGTPEIYYQTVQTDNPDLPRLRRVSKAKAAKKAAKKVAALVLALFAGKLALAFGYGHDVLLLIGAISFKDSTGNYYLDQLYDNKFPSGSLLQFRSGSPAGPNSAAGGSLGAEITLPATPFAAASSKSKAKSGTWSVAASASITIGHFRLKNAGDTEREEGTVTATGGGGDMTVDNTSLASGQTVTVTTYTRTAP